MALGDERVHVRLKLSALWTSLMFLYIYNDYFQLYQPGLLSGMLHGRMGGLVVNQGLLLGLSYSVAIPALMISVSLVLTPGVLRWLSIVLGALYTVIDVLTALGSWWFYISFNCIETVLTLSIIWCAWNWGREPKGETSSIKA